VRPLQSAAGLQYGFETFNDGDDEGSLLEYWRILRRHKMAIAFSGLVGLLLGFLAGIPLTPVYRAKASVEVLNLNEDFMNVKETNPVTTNVSSSETSEEQTQAKLMGSEAVLDRVIEKLDPGGDSLREANRHRSRVAASGWRHLLHLPEPMKMTEHERLLAKAADSLKIRATPHTRLIQFTVDSPDPQLAANFASTLIQEFVELSIEARWQTSQRTDQWLSREIDDARNKLKRSEDALQSYAKNSELIFNDDDTNVATEKLQQVQQEWSAATGDRIAKQSRFELAQSTPPDTLADVINDPGLRDTQVKMNDAKRQLANFSAVYRPEFTRVKRTQAELDTLEVAFSRERADILHRIKNDYDEATRREKLLAAAYQAQAREVIEQGEKAIQYNILKREVDTNRQLYERVLQQMKQSSIAAALRASNVRAVDSPKIPDKPVFPNFKLNAALGALSGLFLSAIVVIIHDHSDRTLQRPGDIKLWADLPELGAIPSAAVTLQKRLYAAGSQPESGITWKPAGKKRNNVALITLLQKPSLIAEAFRSALTSILFVGAEHARPTVLVFTSPYPAEGKTTVVSNLAIAAAEIRSKVLVVDADLRRPCLHEIFDLSNERGLVDLLRAESGEQRAAELIQETKIPGVHVLTAGPATYAAAHLLHSPAFPALLSSFRETYNLIFIDSPPMLHMTDARVAGRFADAVVLIARAGRTSRDAMLTAKARFDDDRTCVLGAILTKWDPRLSPNANALYRSYTYGT
jgi:polysaccharide biosynthesis transport protein